MREDLRAIDTLDQQTKVMLLSFEELIYLLVDFLTFELRNNETWKIDDLSASTSSAANLFLEAADFFVKNKVDLEKFTDARERAWKLHDAMPFGSPDRNLIRLLICCLYDADAAEYETYGLEPIVATITSCLLDLGTGYCDVFVKYAKSKKPSD